MSEQMKSVEPERNRMVGEECSEARSEQNQSSEKYAGTLSKRAQKKYERMKKWKEQDRRKPKSKKQNGVEPGFGAHLYEETDYYYENGLRKVYPYYYTFTTYVKQRWLGRTILDVFTSEFRAHSEHEYRTAIESGLLTCNGKQITSDYVLRDNELLAHKLHRHENPVIGCPIEVLVNTEDLIVVNKPSSIPCHPCGKYRHNSVVFIIGRQMGCANLRNIYRLDRLTSGVLIMGKTTKKTKELEDQVLNRQVKKEYVCRVVGEFPDDRIECREPIGVISQKLGLFRVRSDGKPCHTTFEKLSYNGRSSVVKCYPHTGRTHQIRVHLQYLGYPIVNDPFYNSEAWGPNKNKGGVMERTDQEVSDRLLVLHNIGHWTDGVNPLYAERLREISKPVHKNTETDESVECPTLCMKNETTDSSNEQSTVYESVSGPLVSAVETIADNGTNGGEPDGRPGQAAEECREPPAKKLRTRESDSDSRRTVDSVSSLDDSQDVLKSCSEKVDIPPFERNKWIPDVNCKNCQMKYVDPTQKELVMYLHALRYTGPDWEYSTPLPGWAEEDWTEE